MANTKVTGDVIANGTISTVHIADDAITSAKLDSTATGITFADLAVDTNTLYVDSSNNRVGIGTTTPDRILHVESDSVAAIQLENTTEADSFIDFKNPSRTFRVGYDDSADLFKVAVTNFNNNALVVNSSGNVGIGQGPSAFANWRILEIKGLSNGALINFENSSSTRTGAIAMNDASSLMRFQTMTDADITFEANNAERMRVTGDGNVGIGTTSPSSKLEVKMNDAANNRLGFTGDGSTTGAAMWTNWQTGNSYLDFRLGGTTDTYTKMRITSSGHVGIGTTSPSNKFVVAEGTGQHGIELAPGTLSYIQAYDRATSDYGDLKIDAETIQFGTNNGTERMRITSSGHVGIGTTDPSAGKLTVTESGSAYTGDFIYGGTSGSYGALRCTLSASNAPSFIDFFRASYSTTQPVGAIVTSGSNCLYQSYSDYRLKENVQDLTGALDRLDNLQPKTFNYKNAPEIPNEGFIAHELQEVVPQAVSGEKDGMNEDGTPKYQGVDNAHIVPLLVGAIKELKAEIELLKTQINN